MNIEQNRKMWTDCPWKKHGEEWSEAWGSTEMLWKITIEPRIHQLYMYRKPAGDWLEIGCGHGRMTAQLAEEIDHRRTLIGVDLVPGCVEHCRKRFGESSGFRFEQTGDENQLVVEDDSIAFAFSWDSLVHCDLETIRDYAWELKRVLVKGGHAFLHHSNLGEFADKMTMQPTMTPHLRDPSVSSSAVQAIFYELGMSVLVQELIAWGSRPGERSAMLIDCFTLVRNSALAQDLYREPIVNIGFMKEAAAAKLMTATKSLYKVTSPYHKDEEIRED